MNPSRWIPRSIRRSLLVLLVCGTSGWVHAAPADLLAVVQDVLGAEALPPAPTSEERSALLRVLMEEHPVCPDDAGHAEWTAERFRAVGDVPVAVGVTEVLARLALTDGGLSGNERSLILEYLASRKTPLANARVLQIAQAASAIAVALVPSDVDPELRPLVARSNTIDLWDAALRGARSSGNAELEAAMEVED